MLKPKKVWSTSVFCPEHWKNRRPIKLIIVDNTRNKFESLRLSVKYKIYSSKNILYFFFFLFFLKFLFHIYCFSIHIMYNLQDQQTKQRGQAKGEQIPEKTNAYA